MDVASEEVPEVPSAAASEEAAVGSTPSKDETDSDSFDPEDEAEKIPVKVEDDSLPPFFLEGCVAIYVLCFIVNYIMGRSTNAKVSSTIYETLTPSFAIIVLFCERNVSSLSTTI